MSTSTSIEASTLYPNMRERHLTSSDLIAEVEAAERGGWAISRAAAQTVASQWQTPRSELATFASGAAYDPEELDAEIAQLLTQAREEEGEKSIAELSALRMWLAVEALDLADPDTEASIVDVVPERFEMARNQSDDGRYVATLERIGDDEKVYRAAFTDTTTGEPADEIVRGGWTVTANAYYRFRQLLQVAEIEAAEAAEKVDTDGNRCYSSMPEIKRANKALGHFWFTPSSMRFFSSRIESEVIGGRYFVTSESDSKQGRRYSVRMADDHGEIHNVSAFMEYSTAAKAVEAAKFIAGKAIDEGPAYQDAEVCDDCTSWAVNGDVSGNSDDWTQPDVDLSVWTYNDDGEDTNFSQSPCDMCGSRLAGNRTRFALWA